MKTSVQIVEEMLDILDCDEHWCKFYLSTRDRPRDGKDIAYCLMGAMFLSTTGDAHSVCHYESSPQTMAVVATMDNMALEKGYRNQYYDGDFSHGAHAVEFNNAPETEFEDIRLFLKETLVRLESK